MNALAYETCFESKAKRDRTRAVTADDIAEAREQLIVRRVTHLDQLADKLREDRVRRVVEPMLSGVDERRATSRDVEYVRDPRPDCPDKPVRIANPIYAEVVPRELGWILQEELDLSTTWYVDADDSLNLDRLMEAFQDFFRRHSEHWKNRFMYEEAWPQILLQAYLHRVVNGGGRIEREYGLGRGRVDLLIVWPQGERMREYVVECKVVRMGDGLESTVRDGVEQTAGYMARCDAEAGHLVVIDQREGRSWEEKVFHPATAVEGQRAGGSLGDVTRPPSTAPSGQLQSRKPNGSRSSTNPSPSSKPDTPYRNHQSLCTGIRTPASADDGIPASTPTPAGLTPISWTVDGFRPGVW